MFIKDLSKKPLFSPGRHTEDDPHSSEVDRTLGYFWREIGELFLKLYLLVGHHPRNSSIVVLLLLQFLRHDLC